MDFTTKPPMLIYFGKLNYIYCKMHKVRRKERYWSRCWATGDVGRQGGKEGKKEPAKVVAVSSGFPVLSYQMSENVVVPGTWESRSHRVIISTSKCQNFP